MSKQKWLAIQSSLLFVLLLTIFICLNIGSTGFNLVDWWQDVSDTEMIGTIIWQTRFPRLILAALVGGALGASGTAYQTILRNPLADPFILGVSGGAALGYAIGIGLQISWEACLFMAFLSSIFVLLGIIFLSGNAGDSNNPYKLLLTGVVVNAFAYALIVGLHSLLPAQMGQQLFSLLLGNLQIVDFKILGIFSFLLATSLFVLLMHSSELDAWMLGADAAASLGVNVPRLQTIVLVCGSIMVGAAVSLSGLIGFVGLVVPHAVRLIIGTTHRVTLPASALVGAAFLVATDTIARSLFSNGSYQTELPVGVITALIGAPIFIYIMARETRRSLNA